MGTGYDRHVVRAALENEANHALIAAVRSELSQCADAQKARAMQAYMKSEMAFHGVQARDQALVFRHAFAAHPLGSFDEWVATALWLWRTATRREERYAAIALTGDRRYRSYQTLETLSIYEEMIVTGAWWDYVDAIATHRLDVLLQSFPEVMRREMSAWARSGDLWKRRSSIICQVRLKRGTDLDLLYDAIGPNLDDKDFFIRKAIGWALRAYAWTDPDEVLGYVRAKNEQLSPLSRKEALKNVVKVRPEAASLLGRRPTRRSRPEAAS